MSNHSQLPDEITITWHIDDVLEVRPDLTQDQARQVLQHCSKSHDATVGISWDTLEWAAFSLFGDEPDEEEA